MIKSPKDIYVCEDFLFGKNCILFLRILVKKRYFTIIIVLFMLFSIEGFFKNIMIYRFFMSNKYTATKKLFQTMN